MKNQIITFIGAGNMAHSLIGGLIADGYNPKQIWATAPQQEHLTQADKFGIHTSLSNQEGGRYADIIVLAVKPQILKTVAIELADIIKENKPLVISIAAGVQETDIQRWLGGNSAIVRCMPNTPALITCGATALYANSFVSNDQKNLAESILRAVGITVWLDDESQINTVTALSGSGPAYFFLIMEALEKAACDLGLAQETARLLTLQTALGAARMALESKKPAYELRQNVTSPGGTTECAIEVLEKGELKNLFAKAVQAAQQRGVELAKLLGE